MRKLTGPSYQPWIPRAASKQYPAADFLSLSLNFAYGSLFYSFSVLETVCLARVPLGLLSVKTNNISPCQLGIWEVHTSLVEPALGGGTGHVGGPYIAAGACTGRMNRNSAALRSCLGAAEMAQLVK